MRLYIATSFPLFASVHSLLPRPFGQVFTTILEVLGFQCDMELQGKAGCTLEPPINQVFTSGK